MKTTTVARSDFQALGTEICVQIVAKNEKTNNAAEDILKVKSIFSNKQKIFCRFNPESELSKLNKNIGAWQKASPDIIYLAARALFYNKISGGLYDPRVIEILEKIGYGKDFRKADFSKMKTPADFDKRRKNIFCAPDGFFRNCKRIHHRSRGEISEIAGLEKFPR